MLHANILCLDRVKNCIKEVEEMFPWIVVLAVLGLVMIFAEILMPGFGLFGILGTISLFGSLALTFKIYGLILFLIMLVAVVVVFFAMVFLAKQSGLYNKIVLKDKQEFRATVALIWVTTGCYITGTQVVTGNFNSHVIWLLLIGIIPVFAGTVIGTKLVKIIPQEIFMKLTYILLLLSGIMAII